jgi:aryl-alcohol dehydrogenase-like predicted oxidoreductase
MLATLPFGRTGHDSSRVLFGAAALAEVTQDEADRTLALLVDRGVNHIDVARSYGEAEVRLRPFLDRHRDEFFLATKTGDRTAEGAYAEINESLERLGTDHVDLIQLHNLVEEDEWAVAHGPGGAVSALVKARDEGLVRFIGVTGHGVRIPGMHLRSLERFDFDSVLFPYNYALLSRPDYRADVETLLEQCAVSSVAAQTIKAVARRRWAPSADGPKFSWYEPLPEGDALSRAVAYVLGRDQLFLNTTSDARLLPAVFAAAEGSPVTPTDGEMAADVAAAGVEPLFDGADLERI